MLARPFFPSSDFPRESYLHVSTHQTYIGKALYEHATNCATIAAVACMSSSLLKSSLGPNLLALIPIWKDTRKLFEQIFIEHSNTMQFVQRLHFPLTYPFTVRTDGLSNEETQSFITKLISNGSLFSSSLQKIECFPVSCISL